MRRARLGAVLLGEKRGVGGSGAVEHVVMMTNVGILKAMARKDPAARVVCPACGQKWQTQDALQRCMICRTLFCQRCGVTGFGREFCSQRCREFFFHGDEDEEPES